MKAVLMSTNHPASAGFLTGRSLRENMRKIEEFAPTGANNKKMSLFIPMDFLDSEVSCL